MYYFNILLIMFYLNKHYMIDEFEIYFDNLETSYINESILKKNSISAPLTAKIDNYYLPVKTDVVVDEGEIILPKYYRNEFNSDTKIIWFMTD